MTENSLPFQDGAGDGGPYSADDWDMLLESVGLATGANVGVIPGILNELAVTSTGNNNITVNTGRAQVEGTVYENTASESKTTSSPAVGTTGRRCVLRKDWSARTVRITIISSADGTAALPALTQTDGVTWEIPLASFTITTGGVIGALTDEREFTRVAVPFGRFLSRAGVTRYTTPGWFIASETSGGNPVADTMLFLPILVQEVRTFDRIALWVTTLAAGEVARLGVYEADLDADGLSPGALILDAGTVSLASTGAKEITIDLALGPGYYFLAFVDESTTPRYRYPTAASGLTVPITAASQSVGAGNLVLLDTDVNAGADWPNNGLPDPAPAVTNVLQVPNMPTLFLRDST
jgi:hypothetical protein